MRKSSFRNKNMGFTILLVLVSAYGMGCFFSPGLSLAADRGITIRLKEQAALAGWEDYNPKSNHALIIGISNYKEWPSLETPAADAMKVAEVLKNIYGFGEVKTLLNEEASRANIIQELRSLRRTLTAADSLLIYYAGHGQKEEDADVGYWVPYDGKKNLDHVDTYITNSSLVNDYFKIFKVKHLLVIADSCFSGLMNRGDAPQISESYQRRFEKSSRHILTSGAIEPVPDNAGNGHSPFCTRFLQYLETIGKPVFSTYDLYGYIRDNLTITSPQVSSINTAMHIPGGEFVFMRELKDGEKITPAHPNSLDIEESTGQNSSPDPVSLVDVVGFIFSQPSQGELTINNRTYQLGKEAVIELAEGHYPFKLVISNNTRPIYGLLEVYKIDDSSRGVTFGAGGTSRDLLFKESHLRAALAGSPVRFNLGIQNKTIARYQLSLRKF